MFQTVAMPAALIQFTNLLIFSTDWRMDCQWPEYESSRLFIHHFMFNANEDILAWWLAFSPKKQTACVYVYDSYS